MTFGKITASITFIILSSTVIASAQDTMRVTKQNLPVFIEKMASVIKPGTQINDYTTVKSSKASGKKFTVVYEVYMKGQTLLPSDFTSVVS